MDLTVLHDQRTVAHLMTHASKVNISFYHLSADERNFLCIRLKENIKP